VDCGVTTRHARRGPLTGELEAAALAELADVADGRVDLLAEHAGVLAGPPPGSPPASTKIYETPLVGLAGEVQPGAADPDRCCHRQHSRLCSSW
jgi:hypothetical protein